MNLLLSGFTLLLCVLLIQNDGAIWVAVLTAWSSGWCAALYLAVLFERRGRR